MDKPQIYLLTEKEKRYFTRVYNIIQDVANRPEYIAFDDDGNPVAVPTLSMAAEAIRTELERHRISIPSLAKKTSIKRSGHYFTIGPSAQSDGSILKLLLDVNPLGTDIPTDAPIYAIENPLREDTEREADYWRARRAELGLPDDCYYLNPQSWKMLWVLEQISTALNSQQPDSSKVIFTDIKPRYAIFPVSNVAQSLTKPDAWKKYEQLEFPGFGVMDIEESDTFLALDWSDVTTERKITAHDRSIHDKAISFFAEGTKSGNLVFTDRQVAALLKGVKSDNSGIDEKAIEEVHYALDKMSVTRATIDATKAFELRGITDYKGFIRNYLLPIKEIIVQAKGRRKEGEEGKKTMRAWQWIDEPPVYYHARIINQLRSIPVKYLQTGKVQTTENVIVLRDYLLQRISSVKQSRTVLYSTLYNLIGIEEPASEISAYCAYTDDDGVFVSAEQSYNRAVSNYRYKTAQVRKQVKGMLDNWISQGGLITSYSEEKNGKTFHSVSFVRDKKITSQTP